MPNQASVTGKAIAWDGVNFIFDPQRMRPAAPGGAIAHTIIFNTNGGSAVSSRTVDAGDKVGKPADPARSGHTFDGWYSDAALTNLYDFNRMVNSSFTLYAKWTAVPATLPAGVKTSIRLVVGSSSYTVDGVTKTLDAAPEIVGDRTMVPLRFVAEALGAKLEWDGETQTVTVELDGKTLKVTIGVLAPGMDVPAYIANDRTMVPLRYISETLGCNVEWDPETRTIDITK
jgi:uncharacterized repeat protein (TIGR02543 family)